MDSGGNCNFDARCRGRISPLASATHASIEYRAHGFKSQRNGE